MWKDKTNRNLLGILVVLAVLYAGSYWLKNGSSGSTVLTQDLVVIDTALITNIKIEEPNRQIQFARQDGQWLLTTEENIQVPAVDSRVRSMISALNRMVPSRIASRDPDKWRDYQVDSTGRHVQVFQGQDKTLDLIIGRSSMQGQRTFVSYVRPYLEDNVYAIENFSASSISANSANYRNNTVVNITPDSVYQLVFESDRGDGFTVLKVDGGWQISDRSVDSVRMVDYLNDLRRISSSNFMDQHQPTPDAAPVTSLTIHANGAENVRIGVFDHEEEAFLHSSQNPKNYFRDTAVINKLFVNKEAFLE